MKKMSPVKKSIITAVCIALCVVLPQAFHAIPNAGSIYCPMHIPVLLCGLICGWQYGLLCGIAGPLVSALITGMPPAAVLPGMLVECAAYGALTGLMMQLVHTKKVYPDLYISLLVAMLGGRIISGIAKLLCRQLFHDRVGHGQLRHQPSRHHRPPCPHPQHRLRPHEGKAHPGQILSASVSIDLSAALG